MIRRAKITFLRHEFIDPLFSLSLYVSPSGQKKNSIKGTRIYFHLMSSSLDNLYHFQSLSFSSSSYSLFSCHLTFTVGLIRNQLKRNKNATIEKSLLDFYLLYPFPPLPSFFSVAGRRRKEMDPPQRVCATICLLFVFSGSVSTSSSHILLLI